MSAAMSPAEHYSKRNVGNASVSKYDLSLLMAWLRLGLVLASKQLSSLSLVSLCWFEMHSSLTWQTQDFSLLRCIHFIETCGCDSSGACVSTSLSQEFWILMLWLHMLSRHITLWVSGYSTHQLFLYFHSTEKIERTVQIEASTVEIEERGVKLRLTVVDTPGYGDAINSQDWCVCELWRSDNN